MTSPLYSSYDLFVSSGSTADADGAASDGGYSSDGDISSMYGAYSQHKRRKHERWTEFSLPSTRQECGSTWAGEQRKRSLSLSRTTVIIDNHAEQFPTPTVFYNHLYISSPTTSFSTFSNFMVQMSSSNLEATNTGGRRLRWCVKNGTQLFAHSRRTSSGSSVSGMTTPRCSLGTWSIVEEFPSRTCLSVRPSWCSMSTTT